MNRKKLVLCLLLIALAGSLVYSVLRSPKQQRVATLKYRPGAAAPAARKSAPRPAAVGADDQSVHLAALDQQLPRFSGYRRNIFSPIFREEVKLPPFKPLPLPPKPVALPAPPSMPPPPPPPPPTAEELAASEMAKFTFLGFLKKDGARTVFLSSNNEIFLAKKGSFLSPKYQVSDLTDDAITIKSVAGGRELVIPLVENRALSTRRTSLREH
jgi:hypothetical protein